MRINLGAILGLSAFAGLCYVTLAYPTQEWQTVLQNLMGTLLLLMLVAGVAGRGKVRSYALGFGVASLTYLAICFAPVIDIREKLITHHVLQLARERFSESEMATVLVRSPQSQPTNSTGAVPTTSVGLGDHSLPGSENAVVDAPPAHALASQASDSTSYFAAGHLLWALLLGFAGGVVGSGMAEEPPEEAEE